MPHSVNTLPRLIAHRGLSAHAPENTLAAVRAAHEAGINWVELDVQLLGDGTPVIWHDATVQRCSDQRGRLADLDLPGARKLDAGRWFSDTFRGEPMPTLRDMLALIEELNMGLNLELKVNPGRSSAALVDGVVPTLLDALPTERLLLSSFNDAALARARAVAPAERLAIGVLFEGIDRDWQVRCETVNASSVIADWTRLNQRSAQQVCERGYQLVCYTANDPAAFAHQWEWGVESVISDDPASFIGYLPSA
ncbi:glycerophosphodiester phosphodiesterase family protein [Halomonas urumqiensis]|uniref:Glycerophosphoryl diester phosphodiesterase n=1 Tax=Halomonas urumqiensis TaxID=1684789 RepID=A0A2N7UKS9_9GAMM|nr:glycerophosphodiester phosphodiesterase family protein [Halomonas urumqiensis]PMR81018.1 glycerophosphoryl diester phosphodiesterase [Halomonas urumqiensis]PTB01125.1 glycerophosphoryl diester phosphodiesterase [Halomonas urumqiensis]GHE22855.1 glycerophosphoryl diester phosphodiesterase [Halomonas urumqiensis]